MIRSSSAVKTASPSYPKLLMIKVTNFKFCKFLIFSGNIVL